MTLSGEVKDGRPIVDLEIEGEKGLAKIPVNLDTGFNGELMLTYETIRYLKLDLLGKESFFVASGDYVETDFYRAFLHWFGQRRIVGVLATKGSHNLLGTDLLSQSIIMINMPQSSVIVELVR